MANTIPSAEQVSATLKSLDGPQLQRLAKLSGVPLPTLVKIKHGTTPNPRIGTVFRFWPFLSVV